MSGFAKFARPIALTLGGGIAVLGTTPASPSGTLTGMVKRFHLGHPEGDRPGDPVHPSRVRKIPRDHAGVPDIAGILGLDTPCAFRLLPPGDGSGGLLVADTFDVKRLNESGVVVQTYDVATEDTWFSVNLDPQGTSFWAGNLASSNFYQFDIATGRIESGPVTRSPLPEHVLAGLAPVTLRNFVPATYIMPAPASGPLGLQTVFELDANADQDTPMAGLPDDWQRLAQGGLANVNVFTGILCDRAGQGAVPEIEDKIFKGGKKDIQDITNWSWRQASGLPDKDDITNAYAASYTEPVSGQQLIYFGADRFSNVGDAFIGYWFLQEETFAAPDGKFRDPTTLALTKHVVGDVLVIVNFPQAAGASPEFLVAVWDPDNPTAASNLRAVASGVVCGSVPPDTVCATTNASDATAYWPFVPKSGTAGTFPFESFFEGGVQLEALGLPPTCFASFICETRSSSQFTATLKDFAVGSFKTCSAVASTTCEVAVGDAQCTEIDVSYSTTITNNGAGTFPIGSTVTVTPSSEVGSCTLTGAPVTTVLTQPLIPNASVMVSGTFHVSGATCNPVMYKTAVEIMDPSGGILATTESRNSCLCPVVEMSVTKVCDGIELVSESDQIGMEVNFKGRVTNLGNQPLVVTLSDNPATTIAILPSGPTGMTPSFILPAGEFVDYAGSYFPTMANGGETNPTLAKFTDTITAIATSPLGDTITRTATAVCELCPCK